MRVERETAPEVWTPFADQSGEVPVRVQFPQGVPGVLRTYVGLQEWIWTASFEAYTAFPARLGGTPLGRYRFCVEGVARQSFGDAPYAFCSEPFTVAPWDGIAIAAPSVDAAEIRFTAPEVVYPRSYADGFPFIADNNSPRLCDTCTFRPWAQRGRFERAEVEVIRANGGGETLAASCDAQGSCRVVTTLAAGDRATVRVYDQDGNTGRVVAR